MRIVARAKRYNMGNSPYSVPFDAASRDDAARRIAAATRPAAALLSESSGVTSDLLAAIRLQLIPVRSYFVRCAKSASGIDPTPLDALVRRLLEAGTLSREWRDLAHGGSDRHSDLRDALANAAAQQPFAVQFDGVQFADDASVDALEYCIDRLQDHPVRWFLGASHENAHLNEAIARLSKNDLLVSYRLERTGEDLAAPTSIEGLSRDERTVAIVFAAADRPMDEESVGRVARFSRERVMRALQSVERAGIVRAEPSGHAIAVQQIGDRILRQADASELRQIHRALARIESDPMRRAMHLEDGGVRNDAASHYMDVALDALACVRLPYVQAACDGVLRTTRSGSPEQRAAQAIAELGRRASAIYAGDIVHVGRACLDELLQPLSLGLRMRCESAYYTAAVGLVSDRVAEARAIEELLKRCRQDAVTGTATLYWILTKLHYGSNRLEAAREASERGLESLREGYDPRAEIRLRIHLGFISAAEGDPATAIELIERQIARAHTLGFTEEFLSGCCAAMYVFASLDRFDDAAKWGAYALEQPGPKPSIWAALLSHNMESIDLMLGQPERALGRLTILRANRSALRSPGATMVMLMESTSLMQMNRFDAASGMLREASQSDSPEWVRLELCNAQASLSELRGDREEALRGATYVMRCEGEDSNTVRSRIAAAALVARLRYRLGWLDFSEPAALCRQVSDRFAIARTTLREINAYAELAKDVSTENALAVVAATADNPDRFARALNVFEAGRAAAHRQLLDTAISEFEAIGSPLLAASAREEATALGLRLTTRVNRRRHLTSREAELARHVASGKTNVEIGQLLGLSPKTVGHHLSSILGKCGVRSRVDIAALVIRGTLPIHRAM
jgi:DNA-binding NarL/FixJ family response regulator